MCIRADSCLNSGCHDTSQRLLTALDHCQPDRVPIDLGGNQTGIHKFAYEKLLAHLGLKEEIVIMDLVQQLAKPSEAVLQRLRVDNGIDIFNPVQISAKDMDPAMLKARFGDKVVFWGGGVDSQHVLPRGTTEQVRENVRANLEAFKPGGGYVFNNVHNIQADVPPANILAMFDAAYEFGKY